MVKYHDLMNNSIREYWSCLFFLIVLSEISNHNKPVGQVVLHSACISAAEGKIKICDICHFRSESRERYEHRNPIIVYTKCKTYLNMYLETCL